MTTEEIGELFLVHLYDLAEAAPHPNFFFTLNDFAGALDESDQQNLQKALLDLGNRGFVILAGMDVYGGISAAITIEGSVFVEQGGQTGIIERYRKDPLAFRAAEHPSVSPIAPQGSTPATQPVSPPQTIQRHQVQKAIEERREAPFYAGRAVAAILEDIEDMLERDDSVPSEIRTDLLSDLATLKIQVARNVKNRAVIGAILENLADIPSIAPLVTGLNCIVEAYFK